MITFLQWAGKQKLELPLPMDEDTKRGGIAYWAYPDAYVRQQYPDGYFMPSAADAKFKMGKHSPSRKAPGDDTW